ncbi:hypothetical protein ASG65_12140 [Bacillus sp. Leaf13]|nr:hypothetical protein ASG65_12140 [Bacillus sp. Leaf13]
MLELQNVNKMFNDIKGLKNINLIANKGEIHALIGENGAGKTSIIKTILGYFPIDSGKVIWSGKQVQFGEFKYKKEIGYVPDDETLLEYMTPNEIIEFIINAYKLDRKKARKNAEDLFELLDLKETKVLVNQFSRGMRKKVQLVSALIHNPKLLILDEPIAGFDPTMVTVLKDLLLELRKSGKGIIISTHDLTIAEGISDRVSVVKSGEIVASLTKSDFLEDYENLQNLYSTIYQKEVNILRGQINNVVSSL